MEYAENTLNEQRWGSMWGWWACVCPGPSLAETAMAGVPRRVLRRRPWEFRVLKGREASAAKKAEARLTVIKMY